MKDAFDKAYEKMTPRQQELVKTPLNEIHKQVVSGVITYDELNWLINFQQTIATINKLKGE